jgi:hypothetical protein
MDILYLRAKLRTFQKVYAHLPLRFSFFSFILDVSQSLTAILPAV